MDTRRELDGRATGLMLMLCVLWALQQVAIKANAQDIAPLLQLALRSGIAAVLVGLLMLFRRERLSVKDGIWRPGLLVGLLFALEYLFVGEGLRYTTASHMGIFLYTAPIFAALGLHWKLPSERLRPIQWGGIALAFGGIVVTFAGRGDAATNMPLMWLGDLLGIAGGMAWAATTLAVRFSSLSRAPATVTLQYQLLGAFVILLLAALATGETTLQLNARSVSILAFQSVVVSFVTFLIWFALLKVYLASRLGVLSFLTPLFGIGFGVWLMGDPLDFNFVAGSFMVLGGIMLVSGSEWVVQARRRAAA